MERLACRKGGRTGVSDLINRQATIEAIVNTVSTIGLHDNSETALYGSAFRQNEIIDIIEALPSAQPEHIGEVTEMVGDTISRQAAIEAMECVTDNICAQQAIDALADLPSAEQWIPVPERLPEIGDRTLVTIPSIGETIVTIGTYAGEHRWYISDYGFCEKVIAWSPLPTPYKGGEEE